MTQVARIFEEEKQQALTQVAKKFEEEKLQVAKKFEEEKLQVAKKFEEEKLQILAQRTEQIVIKMLELGEAPEKIVSVVSNYSLDDVEALKAKLEKNKA